MSSSNFDINRVLHVYPDAKSVAETSSSPVLDQSYIRGIFAPYNMLTILQWKFKKNPHAFIVFNTANDASNAREHLLKRSDRKLSLSTMSRSMVQKFQSLASTKKPELIQPTPAQGQDTPNGNRDQMVTPAQQREHLGLGSGNHVKAAAVPKDTRRIVTSETEDHEVSSDQPVKGNSGSATTSECRPNRKCHV
ncbi:hypothetical protein FRC02_009240 [Tulasnella sp. 418]|nr:hypothetical protein FRC02_009240 [Tulasnella sp. 418]